MPAPDRELQSVTLLHSLHSLHRLTATEVTVAGIRSLQARDSELRVELRQNRAKARERQALVATAIRDAGGLPTPLSPAVGKGIAFLKAQLDSGATFTSALLGDVALETVLLERARFTRRLAERLGESDVVRLCDRLIGAHEQTLAWLRDRLAELADTGTSRLRPLPTQVAVASLRKAALVPAAFAVQRLRRRSSRTRRSAPGARPGSPGATGAGGAGTIA